MATWKTWIVGVCECSTQSATIQVLGHFSISFSWLACTHSIFQHSISFIYFVCSSFNLKLYPINESAKYVLSPLSTWHTKKKKKKNFSKWWKWIQKFVHSPVAEGWPTFWNWINADNINTRKEMNDKSEQKPTKYIYNKLKDLLHWVKINVESFFFFTFSFFHQRLKLNF